MFGRGHVALLKPYDIIKSLEVTDETMKKNQVLEVAKDKIVVSAGAKDPKDFFVTKKGLYIWSDFKDRVLDKAEPVDPSKEFLFESYDLKESAEDAVIESNLPKKHIFTESEVSAVVSGLIAKQSKGEEGDLLNNGYANLFYTPSFVVGVSWNAGLGEWGVGAWDRGALEWGAGGRVFSPVTDR